jgi:hypothetical protein
MGTIFVYWFIIQNSNLHRVILPGHQNELATSSVLALSYSFVTCCIPAQSRALMTIHADASLALRPRRLQVDDPSQGWSESASGTTHSFTPSDELSLMPKSNSLSVIPNPGGPMLSSSSHPVLYTPSYPAVNQSTSSYSTAVVPGSDSSSHVFSYRSAAQIQPVCIGDGLDSASDGVIATVVLPTSVGLAIWVSYHLVILYCAYGLNWPGSCCLLYYVHVIDKYMRLESGSCNKSRTLVYMQ